MDPAKGFLTNYFHATSEDSTTDCCSNSPTNRKSFTYTAHNHGIICAN